MLGALAIWAVFSHSAIDLGMGQTSFNEDTVSWGSAIFAEGIGTFMLMFAILGIVDSRSPGDFAGLDHRRRRGRDHHGRRPDHRRVAQPGPRVRARARLRPRQRQVTFWNQLVPVYILPGLVGSALAAVVYDFLANPRIVETPIQEAVTHPDPAAGDLATAAK